MAAASAAAGAPMADAGVDASTRDRLDRAVSSVFVQYDSPGYALGVWMSDGREYLRAYGVANRLTGAPTSVDDHWHIGSVTKTMTAVAVLRLVDRGVISLDDRLQRFVPGIAFGGRVTVRQLLGMRSGVFEVIPKILADPFNWSVARSIAAIRRGAPQFRPGTRGVYDNSNYILLGRVLEAATGRAAEDVIRDEVLVPAGLAQTTLPTTMGMPGPFRRGYWSPAPGAPLQDGTRSNPAGAWTAGNGISTLRDLARWATVLSDGSLLSPGLHAAQMRWTRITVDGDPGWRYGLGVFVYPGGWRGHTGYIPGYSTAMAHDPSSGATVVVTGAGPMGAVARTAMFKVIRVISDPAAGGWPPVSRASPPRRLRTAPRRRGITQGLHSTRQL